MSVQAMHDHPDREFDLRCELCRQAASERIDEGARGDLMALGLSEDEANDIVAELRARGRELRRPERPRRPARS